jgi:hypothetical protein
MNFAASILALQLATAPPVDIPEDWAVPPPPSRKEINNAVRDVIAEEKVKEAEVPRRHEADTLYGDKYEPFAADFDAAAVPGCLRPDGLKGQSPRI